MRLTCSLLFTALAIAGEFPGGYHRLLRLACHLSAVLLPLAEGSRYILPPALIFHCFLALRPSDLGNWDPQE